MNLKQELGEVVHNIRSIAALEGKKGSFYLRTYDELSDKDRRICEAEACRIFDVLHRYFDSLRVERDEN